MAAGELVAKTVSVESGIALPVSLLEVSGCESQALSNNSVVAIRPRAYLAGIEANCDVKDVRDFLVFIVYPVSDKSRLPDSKQFCRVNETI